VTARLRPVLAALAALFLATALGACGQHEEIHEASTEGPYLDVGELQYQVQISRQLNPADTEDKGYLVGVEDSEGQLAPEETWFAVFVKVFNFSDETWQSAGSFELEDTAGKRYEPVEIGEGNLFAYRPARIEPGGQLPVQDSIAEQGVVSGSLLLYKVTNESLANRPIVLHIRGSGREAEVDLDV
jgi:hypothetical protein